MSGIRQCMRFYEVRHTLTKDKKLIKATEEQLNVMYDKKSKEIDDLKELMESIEVII